MNSEIPTLGFRLRSFIEQAPGVLQSGVVAAINNKAQTVVVDYGEHTERHPYDYGFYYEHDHSKSGEGFVFTQQPIYKD